MITVGMLVFLDIELYRYVIKVDGIQKVSSPCGLKLTPSSDRRTESIRHINGISRVGYNLMTFYKLPALINSIIWRQFIGIVVYVNLVQPG